MVASAPPTLDLCRATVASQDRQALAIAHAGEANLLETGLPCLLRDLVTTGLCVLSNLGKADCILLGSARAS